MYFRGIGAGSVFIQSQWYQQVKKASEKYRKASPIPSTGSDPESRTIEAIRTKLRTGRKLSTAELDFLREHSPDLYAKAVKVAQERDTYEKSLRQSQSKEEVDEKQSRKMAQLASTLKQRDPEEAQMIVSAIQDVNQKFKGSDEYAKLKDKKEEKA